MSIILKAAGDKEIWCISPAANERPTLKNIDHSQKKEFEEDFRKHFQN
jgi:hypothetical protein